MIKNQRGNFILIKSSDRFALPKTLNLKPSMRLSFFLVYFAHCFRYVYGLILIPFYGRILGVEEYGRLLTATALYQIIWMIIEYGYPTNGVRDLAGKENRNEIAKIFGQQFLARVYLLPLGVTIGCLAVWLSPILLAEPNFGIWAIALAVISSFHIGWYFQATFQYFTQSIFELLNFIFSLLFILFFVKGEQDGALVLMILFLVSITINSISYIVAIRQFGINNVKFKGGLALLKNSTTLFISRGLRTAVLYSSSYILSLLAVASEVGYYGAAEKIVLAGISFMQPIGQFLLGKISTELKSKDSEMYAFVLMRKGIIGLIAFGCVASIIVTSISPYFIPFMLGPAFAKSIPVIQILGLILPFAACNQALTTYVYLPLRKDWYVLRASTINVSVSIAGLLYYISFGKVNSLAFAGIRVIAEAFSCLFLVFTILRLKLLSKIFNPT